MPLWFSVAESSPTPISVSYTGNRKKDKRYISLLLSVEDTPAVLNLCMVTNLWNLLFCFQTKQWTVPKNPGDKKPVKSETSPVAPRAGSQQKAQVQAQPQQPQPQHKINQGLQVPAVSLYPSRKKVPVKDLPPFGRWLKLYLLLRLFSVIFSRLGKNPYLE